MYSGRVMGRPGQGGQLSGCGCINMSPGPLSDERTANINLARPTLPVDAPI